MNIHYVKNKEGKYFRRRGYEEGYGEQWVDDIENATGYTKRGQAMSRITLWAKNFPAYGIPTLVICKVVIKEEKDVSAEFNKSRKKKMNAAIRRANSIAKNHNKIKDSNARYYFRHSFSDARKKAIEEASAIGVEVSEVNKMLTPLNELSKTVKY